jgi:hypothetical protein
LISTAWPGFPGRSETFHLFLNLDLVNINQTPLSECISHMFPITGIRGASACGLLVAADAPPTMGLHNF